MAKKKASKKTSIATASPKRATAIEVADPLSQGEKNAEAFFNMVEDPVAGPGLRATIEDYQEEITDYANRLGFAFSYDDMQTYLKKRWDVRKPTLLRYCCT